MKFCMLIRRNLALFFNNRMNILLSVASIGVVVCLYAVFLRDFMLDFVSQCGVSEDYVDLFTDRIMLAGLLPVVSTTTSFGMVQLYVADEEKGVSRDFLISPVSPSMLISGYWLSGGFVSSLFTFAAFWCGEIYFRADYDNALMPEVILKTTAFIIFSGFINSALVLALTKGMKNTATFATFANLYGTLSGFLAGSYLPYSFYPSWLKPILFFYPPAQLASLFRQFVITEIKGELFFADGILDNFLCKLGVLLKFDGSIVSISTQTAVLAGAAVILVAFLWIGRKNRRLFPIHNKHK